MTETENASLYAQLIKLGDMMGDGLHHEPGGKWIEKEYGKILRLLDLIPKKDYTARNEKVAKWCVGKTCDKCGGGLKQTRSGSNRVICTECKTKYQLTTKKNGKAKN